MQRLVLKNIRDDTDLTGTIEVAGWTMNDFIPILIEYCQENLPRSKASLFDEVFNKPRGNKLFYCHFCTTLGGHITPSSTKKFISETYLRLLQNKVQQLNSATSSNATLATNTPAVRRYDQS